MQENSFGESQDYLETQKTESTSRYNQLLMMNQGQQRKKIMDEIAMINISLLGIGCEPLENVFSNKQEDILKTVYLIKLLLTLRSNQREQRQLFQANYKRKVDEELRNQNKRNQQLEQNLRKALAEKESLARQQSALERKTVEKIAEFEKRIKELDKENRNREKIICEMKLKAEKVQATMLKSQQSGALKKGISSFAVSDYFLNGKIEEVATRQRKISKPDTQSSSSELREILKVIYQQLLDVFEDDWETPRLSVGWFNFESSEISLLSNTFRELLDKLKQKMSQFKNKPSADQKYNDQTDSHLFEVPLVSEEQNLRKKQTLMKLLQIRNASDKNDLQKMEAQIKQIRQFLSTTTELPLASQQLGKQEATQKQNEKIAARSEMLKERCDYFRMKSKEFENYILASKDNRGNSLISNI